MDPPLRITIDDRERGASAAQALTAKPEVLVEIRRLKTGDYLVEDRLVVERKTILDFAISMADGRLFRQAERLAFGKLPPVLILEGKGREIQNTRFRREALRGALITVTLAYGISVLRAFDGEDTARLILQIARQIRRTAEGGLHRLGRRPRGKRAAQIYLLQGLPRIGPTLAARLLDRFGTAQAAISAGFGELLVVHGIGKRRAQGIRWVVEEEMLPYQLDDKLESMSIQSRFYRAFTTIRARLKEAHPGVKDVTYEIPGGPGATLRVLVGVVMAGYGKGAYRLDTWEVEQVIQACLGEEGLPAPTEIRFAAPEDLGGDTAHRHFFAKAGQA